MGIFMQKPIKCITWNRFTDLKNNKKKKTLETCQIKNSNWLLNFSCCSVFAIIIKLDSISLKKNFFFIIIYLFTEQKRNYKCITVPAIIYFA